MIGESRKYASKGVFCERLVLFPITVIFPFSTIEEKIPLLLELRVCPISFLVFVLGPHCPFVKMMFHVHVPRTHTPPS